LYYLEDIQKKFEWLGWKEKKWYVMSFSLLVPYHLHIRIDSFRCILTKSKVESAKCTSICIIYLFFAVYLSNDEWNKDNLMSQVDSTLSTSIEPYSCCCIQVINLSK
jgi:hypothetical protein